MAILHVILGAVHVLATAAWLGAMLYSLVVLQPRAMRFFDQTEEFEHFIATISNGARRQVLSVATLSAASGLALAVVTWPPPYETRWLILLAAKVAILLLALVLFWYASWRLWPARVMAVGSEIPWFQARFRRVGWCLVALVSLAALFGLAMRV